MPNATDLRTICSVDDALPSAHHAHLCDECGTCWRHADSLATDPACRVDDFRKAHDCPSCGTNQRKKHWTEANKRASVLELLASNIGVVP